MPVSDLPQGCNSLSTKPTRLGWTVESNNRVIAHVMSVPGRPVNRIKTYDQDLVNQQSIKGVLKLATDSRNNYLNTRLNRMVN